MAWYSLRVSDAFIYLCHIDGKRTNDLTILQKLTNLRADIQQNIRIQIKETVSR